MIKIEDDCVGCPQGCINCGRRHTPHYYCDNCGDECDPTEMYRYDDDDTILCRECLLGCFERVSNV